MNLNNRFTVFFQSHFGPVDQARCLLAVSGGVDSMVMLHLFQQAGINIGVAHCNFSLRGDESDLDHELIKQYCLQGQIDFYEQRFDTAEYAQHHKMSIQMAARELRYKWFNELADTRSYPFIATAHHRDDVAETILLNIIRGTGLQGLSGIPVINHQIIRPLLFAGKEQLMDYAREYQIPFRNDASNFDHKYTRNKIRNEIIPLLNDLNPEATGHIISLGEHARIAYQLLNGQINEFKEKYVSHKKDQLHVDMDQIMFLEHASFYIYEIIKEYGFNSTQVNDILISLRNDHTGRSFYSDSYKLIINRKYLIISPVDATDTISNEIVITDKSTDCTISIQGHTFAVEFITPAKLTSFQQSHIYIDSDLITMPLIIRKWKHGDRFSPIGLGRATKKISDFLIDEKVNMLDKDNTFVLETDGTIAAILNHRIAETFKITSATKNILHIYSV